MVSAFGILDGLACAFCGLAWMALQPQGASQAEAVQNVAI
jgi:hypothetical protein